MSARKQQLDRALTEARAAFRANPGPATREAVVSARLDVQFFESAATAMVVELDAAIGSDAMLTEKLIEKRIAEHNEALPDRLAVKLVDSAGTLRLDMNGHRVHMNDAQALSLFVKLGAALDKTETDDIGISCEAFPGDKIHAQHLYGTVSVRIFCGKSIHLSRAKTLQLAAFLVGLADEMEGE